MNYDLIVIHSECGWHEEAVLKSVYCGCFDCVEIFATYEIIEWIDEPESSRRGPGRTARCPRCGLDTVLPESDSYELNDELLRAMNEYWTKSE